MSDPLSGLLAALDLTDTGARTREDIFTGPSLWMPQGRVFGGQVLAQSVVAAMRTIPAERVIHSVHGYFLRPGDINLPITFSVDRIYDGRSFSTRRTQAYQNTQPILSMICSFQDPEPGASHSEQMPDGVPDPESLPSTWDVLREFDHPVATFWGTQRPFDIRHVDPPIYTRVDERLVPSQSVWMKAIGPLPDDPNLHRAALAYASDYTILEPVLRAQGLAWVNPSLKAASLDHAMWWHNFGRADEWVLYTSHSHVSGNGRGLSTGRMFGRDGTLLATVTQEGTIRSSSLSGA